MIESINVEDNERGTMVIEFFWRNHWKRSCSKRFYNLPKTQFIINPTSSIGLLATPTKWYNAWLFWKCLMTYLQNLILKETGAFLANNGLMNPLFISFTKMTNLLNTKNLLRFFEYLLGICYTKYKLSTFYHLSH